MAEKHTPGPWAWDGPPDNSHVVREDAPHMRICFLTSNGPTEANARLITAAPELFVFADHPVIDWLLGEGLNSIPEPQRTSVKIFLIPLRDAALSKATGGKDNA